MADPIDEGQQKVDVVPEPEEKGGQHPQTVSWTQYVGIKEKLGKQVEAETKKVTDLEERLKKTVSAEDHQRIVEELTGTKKLLVDKTTELNVKVEQSLSEKRATLVKRGVSEATVKTLSEKEIDAVLTVEIPKPKPDLGGGGGGESPAKGTDKIKRGFDSLHPQN